VPAFFRARQKFPDFSRATCGVAEFPGFQITEFWVIAVVASNRIPRGCLSLGAGCFPIVISAPLLLDGGVLFASSSQVETLAVRDQDCRECW